MLPVYTVYYCLRAGRANGLRTVILIVSPTIPKWISDAAEVLQYRATRRYLTAHMLEEEKRAQAEYDRMQAEAEKEVRQFLDQV